LRKSPAKPASSEANISRDQVLISPPLCAMMLEIQEMPEMKRPTDSKKYYFYYYFWWEEGSPLLRVD
jgi:hypothetical protein